jgi:acyl-CoA thioesterase-1
MRAKSVDFPLPDGPKTATNSPGAMEQSMRSTMVSGRPPEGRRRVRARSSMRGVVIALVYLTLAACASAGNREPLVIFLGDSLTAGHELPANLAFPALVAKTLRERGRPIRVVNAGVSGDTSSGGLDRVSWLLEQKPDLLVVGLGVNDAFRGQPVDRIEANLRAIVKQAKSEGVRVLLLGMRVPTNYGPDYTETFAAIYPRIAKSEKVDLMPFLLEGVGGHPELNFDDGIHPNEEGQRLIADNVLVYVELALKAKP